MAKPYLPCHPRFKNGKDHGYWSIAEKEHTRQGWVQRHLLYLGEINDSQRAAWTKVTEVLDTMGQQTRPLALDPAERDVPVQAAEHGGQVRLDQFALRRPRQWGACWLGCHLWDQLKMDEFWRERLPDSREGTCWRHVRETLTVYRLIDPGSEWRLHRQWFHDSAMAEVMPGHTSDKTTWRAFPKKIEELYGKARRVWGMDRGIPTEEVLAGMRASEPPVHYLVGTPKGRLSPYEKKLLEQPWQAVREGVRVKRVCQEGEWSLLAESTERVNKERAMRRRQLKKLVQRLKELAQREMSRDQLLLKLGAAKSQYRAAWRLLAIHVPAEEPAQGAARFPFSWLRDKLRQVRRREGRYLLRCNLSAQEPEQAWQFYMQLSHVEEAFKDFKNDLSLRPLFHPLERRIEAHIFVSFLASCLHVPVRACLRPLGPGLTPRSLLEKVAAIQMLDVHFPTTDGRELVFCRYTQPEKDHKMLLAQPGWELPPQSPPRITQKGQLLPE